MNQPAASGVEAQILSRLAVLHPVSIDLADQSAEHAGHAGAASGGGHYRLTIVSPAFTGQPRLARHRMIYAALSGLMQRDIHALAIEAWSPEEF